MATLEVSTFRGENPGIESRKLPDQTAEIARNCRFNRGNLEPIFDLSAIAATLRNGVIRSIFLYSRVHWFNWNTPVSAIQSPIAQDIYDRVYFTGDGVPKVTSNLIATGSDPKPAAAYTLGIQAPATQPSVTAVTLSGTNPTDFSDDETRYYVQTYFTEYGEEGPPGPPSSAAEIKDPVGDTVTLQLVQPATNTENITHTGIYRTITTGSSTDYFLIGKVPISQTSFVDSSSVLIGKLLDTEDFAAPPANMQGLTMMANGIAAGFDDNEIVFSEAYLPYAYKTANRRSTIHKIVGIAATGSSLVVGTEGYPYIYTGISPDAISEKKIELMQACVSARSMVDMGGFVIYASPDGLVAVSESDALVITQGQGGDPDIIGKIEWQDFYPETIHAYHYEGRYIAFYGDVSDTGNGIGGFVFDPRDRSFALLDFYATAGYSDLLTDSLYLAQRAAGVSTVKKWEGATTRRRYTWRSKIFPIKSIPFSCAKIHTDEPQNVGFKLFADGKQVLTLSSLPDQIFRLPAARADQDWQFELFGTGVVRKVTLATSMIELQ